MAPSRMLLPAAALAELKRRWQRRRGQWLLGGGEWPEQIALREPNQALVQTEEGFRAFGAWLKAWQAVDGVCTREVNWSQLGPQTLPVSWSIPNADAVATALGETERWRRAQAAVGGLRQAWPEERALQVRMSEAHFDTLADCSAAELQRIISVVGWLLAHPDSGLYPRQIPVAGIDTKWLTGRTRIIADALAALQAARASGRLLAQAGLRPLPERVRMRIPDPQLAACFAGMDDIELPVEQLARLRVPVRRVLIVENLQSGLACDDLPGTLVLMAKGYAVQYASALPWLLDIPVFYWGDIDTHGMAILDRLRAHLSHVVSVLMDEEAFRSCPADRLGTEDAVHPAARLSRLTEAEAAFHAQLRSGALGASVRLEQERLDWSYAISRIRQALVAS